MLYSAGKKKKKKKKKQYLMTDEGFLASFLLNLSFMLVLAFLCYQNTIPVLTDFVTDTYYTLIEFMMITANQFAWWSILGLLSSSCCAIQIILNAFSLGCAGFNNIIGPIRPTFVALTVLTQGGSWFTAWKYYGDLFFATTTMENNVIDNASTSRLAMTMTSTLVSISLTCMPELLAYWTLTTTTTIQERNSTTTTGKEDATCRNLLQNDNAAEEEMIQLTFRIDSMGCTSCVSTVSAVLDKCIGVQNHSISFEDGVVNTFYSCKQQALSLQSSSGVKEDFKEKAWIELKENLIAAGFPPRRVS